MKNPARPIGCCPLDRLLDRSAEHKLPSKHAHRLPYRFADHRLAGPLHGVEFKTNQPDKRRATSPWEIGDCRLILAMDDFSQILAAHEHELLLHPERVLTAVTELVLPG